MSTKFNIISLALTCLIGFATLPSHAGQTSAPVKKSAKDDFKLTLSNTPYTGNPEDSFVRQTCKPGENEKKQSKKAK
jgi:hypothetical protein